MFHPLDVLIRPVARLAKRFMNDKLELKVAGATGLVPISEFLEEDVFIVGYPKSGNTWFQNLIMGLVYGLNPLYAPDKLVQDLVPDVHFKRYYKRYGTPMFFKSHHLPISEYKRVVYLLRDGRDVMVSYWHQLNAIQRREIDFLDMIQSGYALFPCRWHEHVDKWLSNPYNAEMIVIKYENLRRNPARELNNFCKFVGIERGESLLSQVIESASFSKMRQRELAFGWDYPAWPKDKFFVRRGQVGSYIDEMPPDVLEAFLRQAGAILERCEYMYG